MAGLSRSLWLAEDDPNITSPGHKSTLCRQEKVINIKSIELWSGTGSYFAAQCNEYTKNGFL